MSLPAILTSRPLARLIALCATVGVAAGAALGYWSGVGQPTQGEGEAVAALVNQGAAPTAQSNGTRAELSWGASTLTTGQAVDGYVVKRYEAGSDTPQAILPNCTGMVAANDCAELAMPAGDWKYTVTPVFADNWRGAESSRSGVVRTGPTVLDLDRSVIGLPLPTDITGTVSGFAPNEGITYKLDGTTILTGSPASVGADGTATISVTLPAGVGDGPHTISVIGDDAEEPGEALASILVDTTVPTHALSLNAPLGAFLNGANLYYKGNAAGSFKVVDALADTQSGPASVTFPAVATTGWTHNAETVTTPAGGPYTSTTFSWTPNPASPTAYIITGTDIAGNSSTSSPTFVNDTTAPTGGSISYPNGVVTTLSVPVTTADGTDSQSGVNAGSRVIKRAEATLNTTTETCGAFGGYTATVTLVSGADTSVASGRCYMYEGLISDNVGNQATLFAASVAKVDTSGPRVTAIASQQVGGGAGDGRLQIGDKLILTFNQELSAASVQAAFVGATEISPAPLTKVTLTIPSITSGARDTGSPFYLAVPLTTATFGGTTVLVNNGTATTLTVTVTTLSGALTATSSGTLVFAPASALKDGGGNAAAGTFSTAAAFKLF